MKNMLNGRIFYITLIFGVGLGGLLSILFGRGNFEYKILITACVIIGVICIAIALFLSWLYRRQPFTLTKYLYRGSGIIGLLLVSQIISIPIGNYLHEKDLREAQTFVESLIPALEDFEAQNGYYPEEIDAITLSSDMRLPYLLQNQESYFRGDEQGFNFCITDRSSLGSIYIFNSETGEWKNRSTLSTGYSLVCEANLKMS